MWKLLRIALHALIQLPDQIQSLTLQQNETNQLLRELIIHVSTQQPETPRAPLPSPVGLPTMPLTDPQPTLAQQSKRPKTPYGADKVYVPKSAAQIAVEAARDAARSGPIRSQ